LPCYDADSGHTTENRQRTNGGKRCAGWLLHQDPLYRVRIISCSVSLIAARSKEPK